MLIHVASPRPIFKLQEEPLYIKIQTLRKSGVSEGVVFFSAAKDPEHGVKGTVTHEPDQIIPIEGEPGFEMLEYTLPF